MRARYAHLSEIFDLFSPNAIDLVYCSCHTTRMVRLNFLEIPQGLDETHGTSVEIQIRYNT
jgi:hypothetical protein